MRRVVVWFSELFDRSWLSFFHYCVIMVACIAGIFHASLLWIVIVAGTLSLSSPSDWSGAIAKAARIDAEYRDLGRMLWPHDALRALLLYARGFYLVPLVVGTHMLNNLFFAGLAYAFGMLTAWVWGF